MAGRSPSSTPGVAFFAGGSAAATGATFSTGIALAPPPRRGRGAGRGRGGGRGRARGAGGAGRGRKRKPGGTTTGTDLDDGGTAGDSGEDDDGDGDGDKIISHFDDDPTVVDQPDPAHRKPLSRGEDEILGLDMSKTADAKLAAKIAAQIDAEATAEAGKTLVYQGTSWPYGNNPYTVLHVIQVRMKDQDEDAHPQLQL